MISRCVNPACRAPFHHEGDGRFFTVNHDLEVCNSERQRQVEEYWLCGTCSQTQKVIVEQGRITTAPIEAELASPTR